MRYDKGHAAKVTIRTLLANRERAAREGKPDRPPVPGRNAGNLLKPPHTFVEAVSFFAARNQKNLSPILLKQSTSCLPQFARVV
ncbi:hypothetical protein HDG34_003359 [Paraburkholderia sp. HC6.4b]|nr:hypothetical protein [Paraburkholderia sp. HC6.4b]MBB5451148.1 hypothetical protein [Paraburkholderia sp. Kb1A]